MLPDYGLADLSTLTDETEDDLNDDTFGGGGGGANWDWGTEQSAELAKLHEEFLREGGQAGAGFFGDLDSADVVIEDGGLIDDLGADPVECEGEEAMDGEIDDLDPATRAML